jgi:hypothetical protein
MWDNRLISSRVQLVDRIRMNRTAVFAGSSAFVAVQVGLERRALFH